MKKLLFIFNPRSGREQIKSSLADILDIMVKNNFDVTVHTTQARGDCTEVVADRACEFDRIIVSGGDGTLDEAVTGMMRSRIKVPIGYIPAGSTNDFGNSLGIDKDMIHAAEIAICGRPYPIDVGKLNSRNFVYVAAFGVFTEVSYQTSQDMKNMFGRAAYILEGIKQLRDIPSYSMQVEYDGNVLYDEFIYGMVTNSKSVGGFRSIISGDVDLSDGLFEVTLIRNPRNPIEMSEILNCLTTGRRDSEMLYSFQTSEIRFKSTEEVPWTTDGEFGGKASESLVKNEHKALDIMVEHDSSISYNN